ncbi:hypothetical protein OKA06_18840 [Novosphingobium sp. MW5]|nr:hypothetical protein [Novosphingobium sp. MW5]
MTRPISRCWFCATASSWGCRRTREVTPAADAVTPASSELAVTLPDAAVQLQALHDRLKAEGVTILQPVTQLDFGLNFTAADPAMATACAPMSRARDELQRCRIAVASADHVRIGRAGGFMQVNHGRRRRAAPPDPGRPRGLLFAA